MKLELGHVASSAATLMVKRDAEIRIPFGAGTMSRIPAVPPPGVSVCHLMRSDW